MSVIQITIELDDTLTDPTSVKLSDPTATYGVKRQDNDAVVVSDDTSMTKVSTGVYRHEFDDPADDLTYDYYVEVVYSGETYWSQGELVGPRSDSPAALELRYTELLHLVGDYMGVGRDPSGDDLTRVQEAIDAGYRWYLYPPPLPGEKYSHTWNWLYEVATLDLRIEKESGTASVSGTTLTDSSGEFQSYGVIADDDILADGDGDGTYEEELTVGSVTSETELELSAAPDGGDGSYDYYVDEPAWIYPLPSDFQALSEEFTYEREDVYRRLQQTSAARIRRLVADTEDTGNPGLFAIRAKDFATATGQRYEVLFYPLPSAVRTLVYAYRKEASPLRSGTPYPLGGANFSELLKESCLAEAEALMDEQYGLHHNKRMELLKSAIDQDNLAGPKYLGYCGDPGHGPHTLQKGWTRITYPPTFT